jgi:2-polyprenyl-6-methoxyphenol hydroxylase-like FAD-dependent oxidoreductase
MLLETLYDHIIDKSKLLTGKKVERIRHLEDIVEITTIDGSKYTGDIVVGTDGVHSAFDKKWFSMPKSWE